MNQHVAVGELGEEIVSWHPSLENHRGFESESHHGFLDVPAVGAITDNPVLARGDLLVECGERSQAEMNAFPVHEPANADGAKWTGSAHGNAAETGKVIGSQSHL